MAPRRPRPLVFDHLEERRTPATFTVTNLVDSGPGSLRQAVFDANNTPGLDEINFQAGLGGQIDLTTGALGISESVTINGPGLNALTIDGGGLDRVFNDIGPGKQNILIRDLTISNGKSPAAGGAIFNDDENWTLERVFVTKSESQVNDFAAGGAIVTGIGQFTLRQSTVAENLASGGKGSGGGISVSGGTLTVLNSTIAANTAGNDGGGIRASDGATVTIRNSTITSNLTKGLNANAAGGGIFATDTATTVRIENSTVAFNTAGETGPGLGGGIFQNVANIEIVSSIVAGNIAAALGTNPDIDGTVKANFSLIGNNSGVTLAAGSGNNLVNTNPRLDPLTANGGFTLTHALQAGSPAIDRGSNPAALATDQRGDGFARVVGPAADIGAFEIQTVGGGNENLVDVAILSGFNGAAQVGRFDAAGMFQTTLPTFVPFPGFTGDVRSISADFDGDGQADQAYGVGPGGGSQVRIIGTTGIDISTIVYEQSFLGGVFLAAGDVTGNGKADLIVTPDQGGGGRVVGLSVNSAGSGFDRFADFFGINDPNFRGGARPASGDLNGDGTADVIIAAGFGGGPRVALFNGALLRANGSPSDPEPLKFVGDFFVFEQSLRNGTFVTAGDLTGDARADLIFGGGPGGGPRVLALDGAAVLAGNVQSEINSPVANFFAGPTNQRGGIRVVAKDIDDDSLADLLVGSGENSPAEARTYLGSMFPAGGQGEPPLQQSIMPFGGQLIAAGVFVG